MPGHKGGGLASTGSKLVTLNEPTPWSSMKLQCQSCHPNTGGPCSGPRLGTGWPCILRKQPLAILLPIPTPSTAQSCVPASGGHLRPPFAAASKLLSASWTHPVSLSRGSVQTLSSSPHSSPSFHLAEPFLMLDQPKQHLLQEALPCPCTQSPD